MKNKIWCQLYFSNFPHYQYEMSLRDFYHTYTFMSPQDIKKKKREDLLLWVHTSSAPWRCRRRYSGQKNSCSLDSLGLEIICPERSRVCKWWKVKSILLNSRGFLFFSKREPQIIIHSHLFMWKAIKCPFRSSVFFSWIGKIIGFCYIIILQRLRVRQCLKSYFTRWKKYTHTKSFSLIF